MWDLREKSGSAAAGQFDHKGPIFCIVAYGIIFEEEISFFLYVKCRNKQDHTIVSGGGKGFLKFWDSRKFCSTTIKGVEGLVKQLNPHSKAIKAMCLTHDGRRIITGSLGNDLE